MHLHHRKISAGELRNKRRFSGELLANSRRAMGKQLVSNGQTVDNDWQMIKRKTKIWSAVF